MTDEYQPPGGSGTVFAWLDTLCGESPYDRMWQWLDDNLRLVYAQQWLLGPGAAFIGTAGREAAALERAVPLPSVLDFEDMLGAYVEHWRGVYADLKCKPCLVVGINELVGVDMEMVIVTSEEYVGEYPDPLPGVPAHTFLTRLIDDEWFIAATAGVFHVQAGLLRKRRSPVCSTTRNIFLRFDAVCVVGQGLVLYRDRMTIGLR